LVEMKRN